MIPAAFMNVMHDADDVARHLVRILEGIPGVHMHLNAQTKVLGHGDIC